MKRGAKLSFDESSSDGEGAAEGVQVGLWSPCKILLVTRFPATISANADSDAPDRQAPKLGCQRSSGECRSSLRARPGDGCKRFSA